MALRLYRFMGADFALRSLESWQLRVGRIFELNDPFDCFPKIVDLPTEFCSERDGAVDFLRRWSTNVGIVSFCADYTSPVIWSHYADGHHGIALGFDYEPDEPDSIAFAKVRYSDVRPIVSASELSFDAQSMPKVFAEIFSVKARIWSYEQEYRLYPLFDACEAAAGEYFLPIPDNLVLRSVILGARCTLEPAYILRALKNRNRFADQIAICSARISPDKYRIDV